MIATTPTFAEVLRAAVISGIEDHQVSLSLLLSRVDITTDALWMMCTGTIVPMPSQVIALATALKLSGGAWHDFLAVAGVATEAGGGAG